MTAHFMKWIGFLAAATIAMAAQSAAGAELPLPTIDELRVPSSPAFILLDVSPTSVERPNTPRAFALSFLSATERSDGKWPKDLALEIAPYWWKSRPYDTFESYYGMDNRRRKIGTSIAQTLAISLATTDLENQTGVKGTAAGLGLRFALLQGKPATDLKEKAEAAVKKLKELQLGLVNQCVPDEGEPDPVCLAEMEPKLKKAGRTVTEEVTKMNKERRGLTLEFASALTEAFPDDDTNQRDIDKVGVWLTASYRGGVRSLTFVGVGRYFREKMLTETVNRADLGARLVWTGDSDAMPPLALSLEYVQRFASGGEGNHRFVGVLEYRLPLDNISLVASYGKTFGAEFVGKEDLISTLGINFGFGRGPVLGSP